MGKPDNPCVPSPCGPNSRCLISPQGYATCSCMPGYRGSPPLCKPECVVSTECPLTLTCINQKCVDPCHGTCGVGANCYVINHNPICQCPPGHVGDPFSMCILPPGTFSFLLFRVHATKILTSVLDCNLLIYLKIFLFFIIIYFITATFHYTNHIFLNKIFVVAEPIPNIPLNPCDPSPCGPNSICQIREGRPVCSCLANYLGSPPYCRPECIMNSECPFDKACMSEKCQNPCTQSCGLNAKCNVVNHTPYCTCLPGYEGDAFVSCSKKPACMYLLEKLYPWEVKHYCRN